MAGSDFILGGLLQGLGKGQELSYLEAREEALRRLRSQETIDAESRAEQRTLASEGRAERRDIAKDYRQAGIAEGKLRTAGEIQKDQAKTEFGYKVQLVGIEAGEERKTAAFRSKLDANLAAVRADLDQRNDAASQQLKAQLDKQDDPVIDQITDANGRVILVTKRGRGIVTPYTEREKVDTSDYGTRKEDKKRGPTPGNFEPNDSGKSAAPSNSGTNDPWYSPGAETPTQRVASNAQVAEAAKAKGWTIKQTRQWMQQNGWSIQ